MANKRVRLIIEGRVQGVNFRYSTKDEADDLGLAGWVRNRRGGTVEVIAEGEESKVEELVRWCRQGPPHAHVTNVSVEQAEPTGEFDHFGIARTD